MDYNAFVSKLMHIRTAAHALHLNTRSYAKHKALDEFYTGLLELTDTFAETCAGRLGKVTQVGGRYTAYEDPLTMVSELIAYLDEMRPQIEYSELQNQVDEILTLCCQTAYKLRFLS